MNLDEIKGIANNVNKDTPCGELCDELFAQDQGCIYYKFIFNLQRQLASTASAELGVCTGRGTAHLAGGSPIGTVYGVDPNPYDLSRIVKVYPNIVLLRGRSDDQSILSQVADRSLDLCFVDSDHSGNYAAKEVSLWLPKMKPNGVFLFDDIHLNPSMRRFWDSLALPKVALSGQHLVGSQFDQDVGFGCAICP